MRKDRIASLNNVVQKSGKKYKKKEESTEIRKKVQEFEPCFKYEKFLHTNLWN